MDPEANRSCSGLCLEGEAHPASRGAAGKVLGGGGGSVGVQQAHQPSVSIPPPCCPPFSGLRAPSPTQGVAAPPGSFSRTQAACPSPSAPALLAKSCSSQACPSSWITAADGQVACPPWGAGGGGGSAWTGGGGRLQPDFSLHLPTTPKCIQLSSFCLSDVYIGLHHAFLSVLSAHFCSWLLDVFEYVMSVFFLRNI